MQKKAREACTPSSVSHGPWWRMQDEAIGGQLEPEMGGAAAPAQPQKPQQVTYADRIAVGASSSSLSHCLLSEVFVNFAYHSTTGHVMPDCTRQSRLGVELSPSMLQQYTTSLLLAMSR